MQLIELTPHDLPELLQLCQTAMPQEPWSLHALAQRGLAGPGQAAIWPLGIRLAEQLVAVMIAGIYPSDDGPVAGINLFGVAPSARRQRLASRLLGEIEQRARAANLPRLRIGNLAPGYFWPGLDPQHYTPAVCFALRHGFSHSGNCCNMIVDLTQPFADTSHEQQQLAAAGWEVRRLSHADRPQFEQWLQQTWGDVWAWEGISTYQHDPISCFVALQHGQIRAFAGYGVSGFDLTFGPTGTEPQARGTGLGRILLLETLKAMRQHGYQTAEIGWVGPIAFYHRLVDAQIGRIGWFFEKSLVSC